MKKLFFVILLCIVASCEGNPEPFVADEKVLSLKIDLTGSDGETDDLCLTI